MASHPAPTPSDPDLAKVELRTHNQYTAPRLLREHLDHDPIVQFNAWLTSALSPAQGDPKEPEPEAVVLSTVSKDGVPSSRAVLIRTVDHRGFVIFTNYTSRKSQELSDTGYAALNFYWKALSRQIRVVGRVEKISRKESEEYHATRPRGSQIAAWASNQSSVVEDGEVGRRATELADKFGEGEIECPEHWGGWRIVPL